MAKFLMDETIHSQEVHTARLGGNTEGTRFSDADKGKAVKLTAESQYALVADGDAIEGFVTSVEVGTYDGFKLGGVISTGKKRATLSGAGAVGDYVVAAAPSALGVKTPAYMQVKKAADQGAAKASPFAWRIVSLLGGSGATGTNVLIERVR